MNWVKLTQKRESVHPEAVCNDENEVEVEGEIKIRTQRYEDTLTVKTVVKVGLLNPESIKQLFGPVRSSMYPDRWS